MNDNALRGDSIAVVDAEYMTVLLRETGHRDVEVTGVEITPLQRASYGGGSVHRVTIEARGTGDAPGSMILKDLRTPASQSGDPDVARREIDCYGHGVFAGLGRRLRVPKAYAAIARPEIGQYWLWLEDLDDAFDVPWTLETLATSVRDLAELHAAWWERRDDLDRMPFLRRRAQAMYDGIWAARIAVNCASVETNPRTAEIGRVFTAERRRQLMRLSRAAVDVYPRLDQLPQTLLHHDVWLPNLGRVEGQTVLIDWSYAGPGTPGSDLSQTTTLLLQMWTADLDERPLLEALYEGLTRDWGLSIAYDDLLAGYELTFCLRPAHVLGGPILGGILSGQETMVGGVDLDARLAASEALFQRIERGLARLDS